MGTAEPGKFSSVVKTLSENLPISVYVTLLKTDQELGSAWLERDFEPVTAARNPLHGYRLLILDGHNSHTTYHFCSFAEQHCIIVVCLPPYTTHRLHPCDVGLFGPLASSWKKEVNEASRNFLEIRKNNILWHYSRARERALTSGTIESAFQKSGIWPLDRNVIEADAFTPALNTTTQAAQPVPATVPTFLDHMYTPQLQLHRLRQLQSSLRQPTPHFRQFHQYQLHLRHQLAQLNSRQLVSTFSFAQFPSSGAEPTPSLSPASGTQIPEQPAIVPSRATAHSSATSQEASILQHSALDENAKFIYRNLPPPLCTTRCLNIPECFASQLVGCSSVSDAEGLRTEETDGS